MPAKEASELLETQSSDSAALPPSLEQALNCLLRAQARPARRIMTLSAYAKLQGWSSRTKRRRKEAGLPVSVRPGLPDYVDADACDAWLAGIDQPRHGRRLPVRKS
jgi:hypothetical protein